MCCCAPQWLADGGWAQLLRLADVDIVAKLSNGRLSTPEALYAVGERGSLAQFNAFVFGVYTVHCVVFWGGNLVVEAICEWPRARTARRRRARRLTRVFFRPRAADRAQLPFFERYKAQPGPWPWQKGDKAAREWRALIRRTLRVLAGNFLVSHPVGLVLVYRIVVRWQLASFDARDCPSPTEVFWQICAFMVIEDTLFYWTHRALHDGRIYTSVHKQHHQYKVSVGLASEYAHPVEFLVSNAVPFAAAALLVGAVTKVHASLWLLWTIWRIGETGTRRRAAARAHATRR